MATGARMSCSGSTLTIAVWAGPTSTVVRWPASSTGLLVAAMRASLTVVALVSTKSKKNSVPVVPSAMRSTVPPTPNWIWTRWIWSNMRWKKLPSPSTS